MGNAAAAGRRNPGLPRPHPPRKETLVPFMTSTSNATSWFAVRKPLSPARRVVLGFGAFLLPLALWSLLSYTNVWKPKIEIDDPGDVSYFQPEFQVYIAIFEKENAAMLAEGLKPATGFRSNPDYFPAPHEVARAIVTAFKTPPMRAGEPWLHESLAHSVRIIAYGFFLSAIFGVPIGILCGTFAFFSRLFEPFIDFVRYMPAPVFGALVVAILGIYDGPKVAIIFIGTFFQMVLVVANTTRQIDPALLEAAQTLGARRPSLVKSVIIPGILPNLYNDMRILLGWAWTYLIIAELIGASSGISYFIYQQARYRNFENVYAAIIMIGVLGLVTDQVLAWIGRMLFPWHVQPKGFQRKLSSWLRSLTPRGRRAARARANLARSAEKEAPLAAESDPA